ncbi:MAG: SlyX family protein [Candidatus Eisenbacteria bacterium]
MSTKDDLETRVTQLEEISSHQEQLLRELDRAVYEMRTELDRLEKLSRRQQDRIESLSRAAAGDEAPVDDPPPHY